MSLEEFIIWVYCCVEDMLAEVLPERGLRERGFAPLLTDAEVITLELVGEFQGIDTDVGIWRYFRCHWASWFPKLGSRSQFAKQAMNLWAVKQRIEQLLKQRLGTLRDPVHLVDGFPLPISHFKRASSCQRFLECADYGYCASKEARYYGFKGHMLLNLQGAIAGFTLTPASHSEREAVWELIDTDNAGLWLGKRLGAITWSTRYPRRGVPN